MNNDYPENWPRIVDYFYLNDLNKTQYYLFLINKELHGSIESRMDNWKSSEIKEKQIVENGHISYKCED